MTPVSEAHLSKRSSVGASRPRSSPRIFCSSSPEKPAETMRPSRTALWLSLLAVLGPVVLSEQETQPQPSATSPTDTEQCLTCEVRQYIKTMRLNAIKSQILSKLRMKEAPNISRDVVQQLLPKAPPLQQLLDQYDVLGDDSRDLVLEDDDEHATTETLMIIATERKCEFSLSFCPKTDTSVRKMKFYAHGVFSLLHCIDLTVSLPFFCA